MARTVWNAGDRTALLARFENLKADQRPLWGKMTAPQMVKHCTLPFLSAMGEYAVAPKWTPFRNWPMQKLIIYVLPWPKGAPTAPEFIVRDDGDLAERLTELKAVVERFASRGEKQPLQPHAAFGVLSGKDWGAQMHRHLNHHLTQFGL
jgi:Protein of unknown function (DUF1569)